ncbi:MAG: hypothetical protein QNJ63_30830 [Calothrix sp. MO_192.B10]|nr:hypothetical protein [Calothrix sp. MO_192.B10]
MLEHKIERDETSGILETAVLRYWDYVVDKTATPPTEYDTPFGEVKSQKSKVKNKYFQTLIVSILELWYTF